ncbi:unnamed protein product [Parnassius mnemosyne]|uniref:Uncharacterized protein n=1 Tax=Parnassius mnemosyne TaxID=213953 RepID=A0AAV1LLD5_9NEOP
MLPNDKIMKYNKENISILLNEVIATKLVLICCVVNLCNIMIVSCYFKKKFRWASCWFFQDRGFFRTSGNQTKE